jgi:hypothetical protein
MLLCAMLHSFQEQNSRCYTRLYFVLHSLVIHYFSLLSIYNLIYPIIISGNSFKPGVFHVWAVGSMLPSECFCVALKQMLNFECKKFNSNK